MKRTLLTIATTLIVAVPGTVFFTKSLSNSNSEKTHHFSSLALNMGQPPPYYLNSLHITPENQAKNDIDTFQEIANALYKSQNYQPNAIVAYTISAADLISALCVTVAPKSPSCDTCHDTMAAVWYFPFIRVYLGFNRSSGPSGGFKLYVVPVDTGGTNILCGSDHLLDSITTAGNIVEVQVDTMPDAGAYVLDLISPCPATCDINSPLMSGIPATCSPTVLTNGRKTTVINKGARNK